MRKLFYYYFIIIFVLKLIYMKGNEISVTFFADKDLMKEFEKAKELKAASMGIGLTKKQAIHLALKEAIEVWSKIKNPGD